MKGREGPISNESPLGEKRKKNRKKKKDYRTLKKMRVPDYFHFPRPQAQSSFKKKACPEGKCMLPLKTHKEI